MTGGKGKFAPKLTFEQRCGYYYALQIGIPRPVVVVASGLDRGTITRLASPNYKAYGEIRRKFGELGKDKFQEAYYTKEVQARLAAAQAAGPPAAQGVRTGAVHGPVHAPPPPTHSQGVRVQPAARTPELEHAANLEFLSQRIDMDTQSIIEAAEQYAKINGTTLEYAKMKVVAEMVEYYK